MDDVLDCVRLIHIPRNVDRYIFQFLVRLTNIVSALSMSDK